MKKDPLVPTNVHQSIVNWIDRWMTVRSEKLPSTTEIAHVASFYRNCFCISAAFSLRPTVAYTGRPEFAVIATQHIRQGSSITGLSGLIIPAQGDISGFHADVKRSMITTGHGSSVAQLCGPISRVNHECIDPNAQFSKSRGKTLLGYSQLSLLAIKDIDPGEEVTVHYGPDYFGLSNIDCLCAGCELQQRNGWLGQVKSLPIRSGLGRTRAATEKWKRALRDNRVYTYETLTLAPEKRIPGDHIRALAALTFERCIAPHCRMRFVNKVAHGGMCVCCREQVAAQLN
jgi:hypothetical protein